MKPVAPVIKMRSGGFRAPRDIFCIDCHEMGVCEGDVTGMCVLLNVATERSEIADVSACCMTDFQYLQLMSRSCMTGSGADSIIAT